MEEINQFTLTEEGLEEQKRLVLQTIERNREEVQKLLQQEEKNYDNFVRPLQLMEEELGFYFTPIEHLNYVKNSEKTEAIYNSLLPEVSRYYTELGQNGELYKALKEVDRDPSLTPERKKVVADLIRDFELSGVLLPEAEKERLKEINISLSELSSTFAQNLLKATESYELILEEGDVEGLPEEDREAARREDGKYRFTLKEPSYIAYMGYGPNREKREELYRAYVTRAPENGKLIEEILKLRHEKAQLLGFANYAQLSLATKMATSPQEVLTFLEELAAQSKEMAEEELRRLEEFAVSQGFQGRLEAYDISYWSHKLKEELYGVDDEIYRPYFEKERTVEGLFAFLNRLFKLEFERIDTPVWDERVSCYELRLPHRLVGRLYLDLEAREGKRGGAWMDEWVSHHIDEKGRRIYPIAFIVANFPPATGGHPSLLRHSDVVTLFHEMGHALHHLLSTVTEPAVSGIAGVEWDAVEFPSQFLENFAYEGEVLREFAIHHQNGEPLPEELIEKLRAAKNFQSAMAMVRQLEFGLFDMKIHMGYPVDVQEVLDQVRREVAVIQPPPYNRFQWSFGHIFAGGYSAGYYSYKWAEVLSADAFFTFVDNGIYNEEIAESYLQEILCRGGSRSAMENFKAFLGRAPDSEALLKLCGIKRR
ncbi:MAG: M3 family metallopeptidase [Epsilonproteobacteria bacterium]|nr:peptidase M3 [Campylobacterota bacterium]NPA57023.1 M3 family metallopeptidase [Campylobacterota bacterium]